jgi:uncharacterized protein
LTGFAELRIDAVQDRRDNSETPMLTMKADDAIAVAIQSDIQQGNVESLQQRLRENVALATARIVDRRGVSRTLLHIVADWPGHFPNSAQTVGVLAAAGADVNAIVILPDPNRHQETALHWAASSDDVAVLDALLDAGADIEAIGAVFTNGTAMSDAVVFAQWGAARRLLERGATTTISQAAALGLLDRVSAHCEHQPPPTRKDITNAFWHACRGGQLSTASYLFERGADLNWVGYDRRTPRDAATEGGADDLMQWLDERGAKSNAIKAPR